MPHPLKDKTAGAGADRRGNGDDGADEALHQVETAGAGRHVGDHQHREHGDRRRADAAQALTNDQSRVARIDGKYQTAQRLYAESDHQQRLTTEFHGMVSDPWRQDRGDDLRRDLRPATSSDPDGSLSNARSWLITGSIEASAS